MPMDHLTRSSVVSEVYKSKFLENWADLTKLRKPVIAAVSGFAVRLPSRYYPALSPVDSAWI